MSDEEAVYKSKKDGWMGKNEEGWLDEKIKEGWLDDWTVGRTIKKR